MTKGRTRKLYRHQPLPHDQSIRLIQLLPGKQHQKVQCRLQTVSTQSCPEYEAISYVWGPRNERTHILCHGKLVKIPTNLLHCLQRLRHEKKPRILWADSVCINQKDRRERSQQVRIMGSIFEQAERVMVWFGRGLDFDAKVAFDLIQSLVPRCRELDTGSPITLEEEIDFLSFAEGLPSSHWKAFASLLETPWTSRGWVLQEIGLAREGVVVCGLHETSWQGLLNITHFIQMCSPKLVLVYNLKIGRFFDIDNMQFQRSRLDVGSLLDWMRNFKTSDPRDRIYAMLAHKSFQAATATIAEPISIDYGLPCSEVYLAMARFLLQAYSSVDLLNYAIHTCETIQGETKCISWVPQWDISPDSFSLVSSKIYGTGKHTTAQLLQRSHCLDVGGLAVDHIDWQSEVLTKTEFDSTEAEEREYHDLTDVLKKITELGRESGNFEEVFRNFCLVLNARNRIRSGHGIRPRLSPDERIADCLAYLKKTGINLGSASGLEEKYGLGHTWRFSETAEPCSGRRFFITSKGYFGIGPEVSLPGDKVCVFFGGATPFVLWPQKDGTYRLCGECYVHGLMDGEAIEMWERSELEEETFTLT